MIRLVPGTRQLDRLVTAQFRRTPSGREVDGRAAGAQMAEHPYVDDQIGDTLPPGARAFDHRAVAEMSGVGAALERDQGRHRAHLRRRGAIFDFRRARLAALKSKATDPEEPTSPGDSRRIALGWWAWLLGLCVASAALDSVVLLVLGMDPLTTWVIAAFVGTAQVVALVDVGGRLRDRHENDSAEKGWVLIGIASAAAVAFGLAAATLRSARMTAAASEVHVAAPSFLLGVLTFASLAFVIDTVALTIGHRLAGKSIRAQLVAARIRTTNIRSTKWATRRFERAKGRFLASAERALSQLRVAEKAVDLVFAQFEADLADYYDGACSAADAPTGAALAAQYSEMKRSAVAAKDAWSRRLDQARAELSALVSKHGEELVTSTKLEGGIHVVTEGQTDEAGEAAA